jgi:hypothetical protein
VGKRNEDASFWCGQLAEHSRAHQNLKLGTMNTDTIGSGLHRMRSDRPARSDVRDSEALGNPAHCLSKRDAENTHHQVNVGVAAAHVADKAADAVFPLEKMQGRIGIAMRVIVRPPALGAAMTDSQTKRLAKF